MSDQPKRVTGQVVDVGQRVAVLAELIPATDVVTLDDTDDADRLPGALLMAPVTLAEAVLDPAHSLTDEDGVCHLGIVAQLVDALASLEIALVLGTLVQLGATHGWLLTTHRD
jgi:hypothetical protein